MIGMFWNIRGLSELERVPALINMIKSNHVDFVGILETKKKFFHEGFLRSLTGNIPFTWNYLPAQGSAGGILVGVSFDKFQVTMGDKLEFSLSNMFQDKRSSFCWKLVTIYGSPYEEGKQSFLEELHKVMQPW